MLIQDINLGDSASEKKKILEKDILKFAELTGDHNPIHVDEGKAKKTIFGGRIAHGFLVGATISALIAKRLPGEGSIYLEQNLIFKKPVYPDDVVETRIVVTEIDRRKNIVDLKTECYVKEICVITGSARILVPGKEENE